MRDRHLMRRVVAIAAIAATLIAGCGETSEALVASAKAYLLKHDNPAAVIQLRNALEKSPNMPEARFLLGKALLETGDAAGAEKELRRALELQYPAEQVAPPWARALVLTRDYKKVTDELARVQVAAPEARAELYTAVGQAHLALGNADAARNAFAAAVAAQSTHVPGYLGQARISAQAGDHALAMETVDRALTISPKDPDALQLKGDILAAQGQFEPAIAAYRSAAAANPASFHAHTAVVSLLLQQNKPEEAAKQLEALKQVAPKHPHTFYLQALLAFRQKNYPAARDAIQQHLRGAPENPRGLTLAGAISVELKSYAQAEGYLLAALKHEPRQQLARRALITTYLRNGQAGKALDTLKPVLPGIGRDAQMLALAGEVYMANAQPAEAATYFEKATALDPGDPRKRTAVAVTHLATGETDRGFRELDEAAAMDTGIRADLMLIAAHVKRRQYDKAFEAVARLEKKQPGTALPHHVRGGVLLAKADSAGARRSFENAWQIDPTFFPAVAILAQLDLADKKPDAARKRFEAFLEKDPKHMQALLSLAAVHVQTAPAAESRSRESAGQPASEEAITLIRKAISAHPMESSPRVALITQYLRAGEHKKAVTAAQEAMAALPARSEILDAAGRAHYVAGETGQAVTIYKQLASVQRESPLPYLRMAEIQAATKNNVEAMDSLRKALAIRADLIEAQQAIVSLELQAGRVQQALEMAQQVQKQRPKVAVGYALEGDIHAGQKNWASAATAYRAGLKQGRSTALAARLHNALAASSGTDAERFASAWLKDHPNDGAFRLHLAQLASIRQEYPRAAELYRKLLDSEPNNALVLNNLAWVERQLNDPKAIEHAEKANALAPNQPAIMDTLGVLLVEKGDTARGLPLLQKASTMAPQAPAIRLNLARALMKAGQKDAARKELDELAKLGDKFGDQAEVTKLRQSL